MNRRSGSGARAGRAAHVAVLVLAMIATAACDGAPSSDPVEAARAPRSVSSVRCGIDVLEADGFATLAGRRVGLITNHTGLLRDGRRTVDALWESEAVDLVALFSPEHGFEGTLDREGIGESRDDGEQGGTGLVVHSLYGETRRPTAAMLTGIDVLAFDVQDIGCRFYTYISTLALALEAASEHGVDVVVLDRPNPLGGAVVEGPVLDAGRESFVGIHALPVRHGLTVGEFARLFASERGLDVALEVVPLEGWSRTDLWCDTDLVFTAPSPNMRRPSQALLYPGVGLLEFTNLSVGRGTDTPFERIGAPWIDGPRLARLVADRRVPGVVATAVRFTPTSSTFAGEACGGVDLFVTDWRALRAMELWIALATSLRDGFDGPSGGATSDGAAWDDTGLDRLLGDADTLDDLRAGADPDRMRARWAEEVAAFDRRRAPFLLYD